MPANVETETMHVTLTLPKGVAQHVRDQVASGAYRSPGEFIESVILTEELFDTVPKDDLIQWMNTEGVRRLEALKANPSSGLSLDQAFAGFCGES